MIHSARPIVSPVANIVFALFCFVRFWKVGTDGRTYSRHVQKQWSLPAVTVGRPSGSRREWLIDAKVSLFQWHFCFLQLSIFYWSTRPTLSHSWQCSLYSQLCKYACPSTILKFLKNKFQFKIMFTTCVTVRLAKRIIDDTCLVFTVAFSMISKKKIISLKNGWENEIWSDHKSFLPANILCKYTFNAIKKSFIITINYDDKSWINVYFLYWKLLSYSQDINYFKILLPTHFARHLVNKRFTPFKKNPPKLRGMRKKIEFFKKYLTCPFSEASKFLEAKIFFCVCSKISSLP